MLVKIRKIQIPIITRTRITISSVIDGQFVFSDSRLKTLMNSFSIIIRNTSRIEKRRISLSIKLLLSNRSGIEIPSVADGPA